MRYIRSIGKKAGVIAVVAVWFCLMYMSACAQSTEQRGIVFFNGTWAEALQEAKKNGKPLFVDVYTSWCLPCKKMEREIFPLPQVAELYNNTFINYRINAEEGEGPVLKNKYNVNAYPSYLFINADGRLIARSGGYNEDPAVFLEKGRDAIERLSDTTTLEKLQQQYADNRNDKELIRKYIVKLNELKVPALPDTLLHRYFLLLSDSGLADDRNRSFLLQYMKDISDTVFNYVLMHQPLFVNAINNVELTGVYVQGKERLGILLSNLVLESCIQSIGSKNLPLLQQAQEKAKLIQHAPLKFPYTLLAFSVQAYNVMKDTIRMNTYVQSFLRPLLSDRQLGKLNEQQYKSMIYPYISGFEDSTRIRDFAGTKEAWKKNFTAYYAPILNLSARSFAENMADNRKLMAAMMWSKRSLALFPDNPDYLNTMAMLCYRTGNRQKALAFQQQSVRYAREKKVPPAVLEKLQKQLADMENNVLL